jgi:hypothetical protein
MNKKVLFSGIIACLALGSQAQVRYVDDVFSSVKVTSNILYGTNAYTYNPGSEKNLFLDLYEPQGDTASERVLIIIAHEGGFISGTKTDNECVDYANRMAKKGYVVASIDYRTGWGFAPTNTREQNAREIVPALWRGMQDGKAAVRFFRKSVSIGNQYKIDEDKIISGGFGAGAFIPIQNEFFDAPIEFTYDKVSKKDGNGNPIQPREPYIDTTNVNVGGFEGNGQNGSSNPGFSWRSLAVLNYCGALGDTTFINVQRTNENVPIISCHGDQDDITPIGTDIVRAAGQFAVLEVSGSYDMARTLARSGDNAFLANANNDGLPDNRPTFADANGGTSKVRELVKSRGTYVFSGENYQPYDASPSTTVAAVLGPDVNNATVAATYMDTLVKFTTTRLFYIINNGTAGIGAAFGSKTSAMLVYPNPARGNELFIDLREVQKPTFNVRVFDMAGREVFAAYNQATSDRYQLDKSSYQPGTYIIQVSTEEETYSAKVLVD